jgi:aminopeptidase-like protein
VGPKDSGETLHGWATDLFPIPRSLTGHGVRTTLAYLKSLLPEFQMHCVPSGTKVLDWVVPNEWLIRDAYVADLYGNKLIDWTENNLHVVGYSVPVEEILTLEELLPHLHWLTDHPDAVPYVTSYYRRDWGFCLPASQVGTLGPGPFRVRIDSEIRPGQLDYAEAVIPGATEREVLLTSYVCHPSMANNELSGPVVLTALGRWLKTLPSRRYTYRLLLAPETIGPIAYIDTHLEHLRAHVDAGWVLTCIGDERTYSYLESRMGGTLADRCSIAVLSERHPDYRHYSYLDRGSDERQWCFPGVDLPVCSVMRSKYDTYPEYHTSKDDLTLVTPAGLEGGLELMKGCISLLEKNDTFVATTLGEPHMSRYGLYPTTSDGNSVKAVADLMNVLAYCDGEHDTIDISQRLALPVSQVVATLDTLESRNLVQRCPETRSPR